MEDPHCIGLLEEGRINIHPRLASMSRLDPKRMEQVHYSQTVRSGRGQAQGRGQRGWWCGFGFYLM